MKPELTPWHTDGMMTTSTLSPSQNPVQKAVARISEQDALDLFLHADLLELGAMAETVKQQLHPSDLPVTFVIDRNLNYTNVCNVDCMFCAFYRHEGDADAYVLDYETQIKPRIQELVDANGTQLLLQGGVNPNLPFEYYTNLVETIRKDFPSITIHAFSPTEIAYMAKITGMTLKETLQKLIAAGLSSIPGAGAEILSDRVRDKVSPKKVDSYGWLEVMEAAHELGLKTTATMMFGMVETPEEIIQHLIQIRDLQDKYNGFTAFIPWTFQRENTKLQKLPTETTATGVDFLRVLAISRIVLDNVPNIQSSWITQGKKLCQTGLFFGANDVGGVLMEENVVTAAGIKDDQCQISELISMIHNVGRDAAQRNTRYEILKEYKRL